MARVDVRMFVYIERQDGCVMYERKSSFPGLPIPGMDVYLDGDGPFSTSQMVYDPIRDEAEIVIDMRLSDADRPTFDWLTHHTYMERRGFALRLDFETLPKPLRHLQ